MSLAISQSALGSIRKAEVREIVIRACVVCKSRGIATPMVKNNQPLAECEVCGSPALPPEDMGIVASYDRDLELSGWRNVGKLFWFALRRTTGGWLIRFGAWLERKARGQ